LRSAVYVALVACLISGCDLVPKQPEEKGAATVAAANKAAADCTSRAVVEKLRDAIFDTAIAKVEEEEATKLNSLRSVVSGRLENPLVLGFDEALQRSECSGMIIFGLPPNTKEAFKTAQLTAEIGYAVQPAADKSGLVVAAIGIEPLVDRLTDGAERKRENSGSAARRDPFGNLFEPDRRGPPPPPVDLSGPPIASITPSFACKGKLNRVERIICDDAGLADMDRGMAEAWREAKVRTPPGDMARLEAKRRAWLNERNSCSDGICIAASYDGWTSELYSWDP
jgi:hypothetical protein